MSERDLAAREGGRACPLCAAREARLWLEKGTLRLCECRRCGMVYAATVPSALADGTHYARLAEPYYLSPAKLESDYAPVRYERELKVFRQYCRGGGVLDVGCSTGAFLFQLKSRWPGGYVVLGTDVAGPALDYAESQGVPVLRSSFLNHDFGPSRFTAITFWAVLEHVAEPRRFLEKAAALLERGGHCFVLVPNLDSLAVRLLGARYRYLMEEHLNYFAAATLGKLVDSVAGWERVLTMSTHFNPVVLWQDWWKPRAAVLAEERGQLLKRTTAWKQNALLAPLRIGHRVVEKMLGAGFLADNLLVVMQKR